MQYVRQAGVERTGPQAPDTEEHIKHSTEAIRKGWREAVGKCRRQSSGKGWAEWEFK